METVEYYEYFACCVVQLPLLYSKGDNDAEMLQLAAVGVAMNNAKPKAKAAADITIEVTRFIYQTMSVIVFLYFSGPTMKME